MSRKLSVLFLLLSVSSLAGTDPQATDLFPAVSKDKTGYINRQGELTIPCVFEDGRGFSQGLAAAVVDGKWGYINGKGKIVIKPQYQAAGDFADDRACVRIKDRKYGYISPDGAIAVEPRYYEAGSFSEGFAVVMELGPQRTVLIDKAGRAVFDLAVSNPLTAGFSEGLVFTYTKEGARPAYLDKDGKVVLSVSGSRGGVSTEGGTFSEGLAAVRAGGQWGYIDRTGKWVIAPEYVRVTPFRQGLACAEVEEKRNGEGQRTCFLIGPTGTRLKQIPGFATGGFSEGRVVIQAWHEGAADPSYGYMDTRGEMVIQPRFEKAQPFQDGLARVRLRGNDAYIDRQGRTVWTGEPRGDERVTSYSGRPMLRVHADVLEDGNGDLATRYVEKMTRQELVKGSRQTLKWLLQDPKRTTSPDIGRGGAIGLIAVAPFFHSYCRSFAKAGEPIDPSPFRAMLIEKKLDSDFRGSLAAYYGHPSVYATSWEQLAGDVDVLSRLVGDATEDEALRREAADTLLTLVDGLYTKYRQETVKDEAPPGAKKAPRPDIVAMLGATPCPFSPAQKARWEALGSAMDKAVQSTLRLYQEAQTERTRRSVYGWLEEIPDYHLLRDARTLERIGEIEADRAKAKGNAKVP
jgi:hypothetical protein